MIQGVDRSDHLLHDLDSDEHDDEAQSHQGHLKFLNAAFVPASIRPWFLILRTMVVLLALWGLIDVSTQAFRAISIALHNPTPSCWCGNTDHEAIAIGCRYDHIAVDWLPRSCIDSELTKEFDASGPGPGGAWLYYDSIPSSIWIKNDSSKIAVLTIEQIDGFAERGKGYFATREWHIQHCMFIWKKQLRAGFARQHIEPWNNNEEHIQHCSDYIMQTIR